MKRKVLILMGNATVGKDTLCKIIQDKYPNKDIRRVAFADELKFDLEELLHDKMDIDIWNPKEKKEIIRPILIAYGQAQRAVNPDYWIQRAIKAIRYEDSDISIITDCRFLNEFKTLPREFDCHSIYIDRAEAQFLRFSDKVAVWRNKGDICEYKFEEDKNLIQPACQDEFENNTQLRDLADTRLIWGTCKNENTQKEFSEKILSTIPIDLQSWLES